MIPLKRSFLFLAVLAPLALSFYSCGKEPQKEVKPLYELQKNYNIPKFDSDNAYRQVEAQVKFGPRNPGSRGHDEALYYISNELKKYADDVKLQSFNYPGYNGEQLALTNIIAKFNPDKKDRILFCAHWDTRPRAEHAKDTTKRNQPILGANDGASGCGVLLELARLLKNNKVNYGIDLVLFDGEDYGKESDLNNFCLGSKYYSAKIQFDKMPAFAVLLDLVGDKEAQFPQEAYSMQYAPDVVNMIWEIAQLQNSNVFLQEEGNGIYDDHVPLEQAGIKAIDIIDSDLVGAHNKEARRNYWHSEFDNMSNISKETLGQLGKVITYLIYSIQFNK